MSDTVYQERDIEELGGYYTGHVVSMTREGLHSKSAIAAELAHRDKERDELRAEVERAEAKTAAEYEAHRMTQCERDALRAEVERLKQLIDDCVSEGQEVESALPSGVTGTWKQRVLAGVETLKADKARP